MSLFSFPYAEHESCLCHVRFPFRYRRYLSEYSCPEWASIARTGIRASCFIQLIAPRTTRSILHFRTQYVSNPPFQTRYYFLLRGPVPRSFPFDRARINRLTGISPREYRTGKRYNRKSKEYRVGGREREREKDSIGKVSDRRERRGRVTNATRGMHLVRFE